MHQLAEERGWANVDALGRALTAKQFLELEAYKQLDPFREVRADYRAAQVAQMLYNVNRGKHPTISLNELLLNFDGRQKPKQSVTEQLRMIKVFTMAYGKASD